MSVRTSSAHVYVDEYFSLTGDHFLQEPTPTPDFIDNPELPPDPTQLELGEYSYWYNCMPCHGDYGQGLTEAWRMTWPDDHRNCWDRGCHGGRVEDQGFPIPESIPPVFDTPIISVLFPTELDLYTYLVETHPPQRPGVLEDEEYWALTALLLAENDLLSEDQVLGSTTDFQSTPFVVALGLVVLIFLALWISQKIFRSREIS